MACLDNGTGPPLLLLHGLGGSMWQWEHQQCALSGLHRVITPDMPGSGLSDRQGHCDPPATLLKTILAFMDTLQLQRATLIGHSMGAGLAIGMSLTYPERVSALVLVSGLPANVLASMTPSMPKRIIKYWPLWLAELVVRCTGRQAARRILAESIHDHTLLTPIVVNRSHRHRLQLAALRAFYAQTKHIPEWEREFASRLADIGHPTLVLWGTHDKVFPLSVGQAMQRTIPNSEFVVVPNAGHMPQWERPDVVNPAVLKFLACHGQ